MHLAYFVFYLACITYTVNEWLTCIMFTYPYVRAFFFSFMTGFSVEPPMNSTGGGSFFGFFLDAIYKKSQLHADFMKKTRFLFVLVYRYTAFILSFWTLDVVSTNSICKTIINLMDIIKKCLFWFFFFEYTKSVSHFI